MDKETSFYRAAVIALLSFIAYQLYVIDDKSFTVNNGYPLTVKIDDSGY